MGRYHIAMLCVIISFVASGAQAAPSAKSGARNQPPAAAMPPPVKAPADKSLPSSIPIYKGARPLPFKPAGSADNRHFLIGSYLVDAPFDQVLAFYKPRLMPHPPIKVNSYGPYKAVQGWFKDVKREDFVFRVNLLSPAYDPKIKKRNPKVTQIQFFMETS